MRTDMVKGKNTAIWKKVIKGALIGNIITLAILAICAVLLWQGRVPENVSSDLVIGSVFAGAILAGVISAAGERGGTLYGAIGGLAYVALVAIIGLYRVQGDFFNLDFIKIAIAAIAGGAFGGIIATSKKPKKKNIRARNYTNSNQRG